MTTVSWTLPLSLLVVLLADQLLKSLVLAQLREARTITVGSIVRIRPLTSRPVVATWLGFGSVLLWSAWLGCLLAVLLVAPGAGLFEASVPQAAIGAALGGAASNLVDLVARRGVVDYLDLGAWPSFNLADIAIVAGVVVGLVTR